MKKINIIRKKEEIICGNCIQELRYKYAKEFMDY